jgi:CubicO group peptidase (beta-lactamase class C family)
VTGIAKTTLVGAIAPFSFVRTAQGRTDELERYLRGKLVEANTLGIAVAVVREEEIVWSVGVGWADRERRIRVTSDTVFQLASVSKTLTCAGIMALVEDGVIDLDADVNTYLPFQVYIPHAPSVPITMRNLLTHTSAIRDRWQVWGHSLVRAHAVLPRRLADLARRLLPHLLRPRWDQVPAPKELLRPSPGDRVRVLEPGGRPGRLRGRGGERGRLRRAVQATGLRTAHGGHRVPARRHRDLEPRDAVRHRFEWGELEPIFHYGYPDYRDGALRTSAVHLARWLGAFMNFGAFDGARVLDESTVREIRRQQIPDLVGWRQGLIWYGQTRWGFLTMGHTGGDYGESTRLFFRPDRRVGVISLTNAYLGDGRWVAFSDIERRLFQEFS